MRKVSQNFLRAEFACKCGCGFDTVDVELLEVLQFVRWHFDAEVIINSACRCGDYNAAIKGHPRSKHTIGQAADIAVEGIPASIVADLLDEEYPDKYGIGRYKTFTHIDVQAKKKRWTS